MTKLDLGWMANKDWIKYDNMKFVIREDAPQIAQESYKRYLKQLKEASKRGSV